MDFYVIPTRKNLELSYLGVGGRLFCLAHFYKSDPEYRQFFLNAREHNPDVFITLDNSAAERALVTEDVLIDIVKELKPSEVVAPDILFDKDATITNLEKFIDRMKSEDLLGQTEVFGCPQGKTKDDWLYCYKYMLDHDDVSTIGMSKIAIPFAYGETEFDVNIAGRRQQAVQDLRERGWLEKPLHFLGMGDPREYSRYTEDFPDHKDVFRSSDSCYSVLAAVKGIDFYDTPEVRVKTTEDFYEIDIAKEMPWVLPCIVKNVQFLNIHSNAGTSSLLADLGGVEVSYGTALSH